MGFLATVATSRRGYLSQAELEQFADITVTDPTEADDQISMAEELIDEFVGPQQKFLDYELRGLASAGGASSLTLESSHQNIMQKDFLKGCWVEIIGGTNVGDLRKITGQTLAGVITVDSAWTTAPDSTSYYRIWQLGKFPRYIDVTFDGQHEPNIYYKTIPEKVRRAVAAQVEFIISMGTSFFNTDKSDYTGENIGDYGYTKNPSAAMGVARLIAPKAKILLRGISSRLGAIID